jgi:hypothetical protein
LWLCEEFLPSAEAAFGGDIVFAREALATLCYRFCDGDELKLVRMTKGVRAEGAIAAAAGAHKYCLDWLRHALLPPSYLFAFGGAMPAGFVFFRRGIRGWRARETNAGGELF